MSANDAGSADRATLEYSYDCGQGDGWTAWSQTVKSITCPALPDQLANPLTVKAQIRDKDGGLTIYTKSLTVSNAAPVASISATSPTSFQVGGTLSVQATFTDKGVNDAPWSYTFTWGDGTTSTGTVTDQTAPIPASHAYAKAGTFSAYVTVRDKDGGSGGSPTKITVTVSP
jgi:PKD repeat protein